MLFLFLAAADCFEFVVVLVKVKGKLTCFCCCCFVVGNHSTFVVVVGCGVYHLNGVGPLHLLMAIIINNFQKIITFIFYFLN